MIQFRGAPWNPPQQIDSSGRLKPQGPPEFFTRYMRLAKLDRQPAAATSGGLASSNFVQCDANPGVALENSTHKFRLLMVENGNAKTVGRFHVEQEGIEGYNGYSDMQTKGPLGVAGVPVSIGNIGPPGVALLPKLDWQRNKRNRPQIDEGNYDKYGDKENIFSTERFTTQRLGNESARHEKELAVDVFNEKGRHAQVASLRKSFTGFGTVNLDGTGAKTSRGLGIYDERGLTLASCASHTSALSAASDLRRSLAFTMATPNKAISFRNVPFRPATSLLKDKGQYTGKPPDHNKQCRPIC